MDIETLHLAERIKRQDKKIQILDWKTLKYDGIPPTPSEFKLGKRSRVCILKSNRERKLGKACFGYFETYEEERPDRCIIFCMGGNGLTSVPLHWIEEYAEFAPAPGA